MAQDCFIQKSKVDILSPNLMVLNCFMIKIKTVETPSSSTQKLVIKTYAESKLFTVDGTDCITTNQDFTTGLTNEITIPANTKTTIYCKNGDYSLALTNRLQLCALGDSVNPNDGECVNVDLNQMQYTRGSWDEFICANTSGDASTLRNKTFYNYLLLRNNNIYIDASCTQGARQTVVLNNSNRVIGDIADIGKVVRHLYVENTPIGGRIDDYSGNIYTLSIANTNVTGTIEGFVVAQVNADTPRTNSSIVNNGNWGNKITFDGSTFSTGNDTIKWRPTTSSVVGGVTDVMSTLKNKAIVIDADGNKVADTDVW